MLDERMEPVLLTAKDHQAADTIARWQWQDVTLTDCGGAVLYYRSEAHVRAVLTFNGALAAQWTLPAAPSSHTQLFALPRAVSGTGTLRLELDGPAELNWIRLHAAEEVVVGENPIITVDMPDPDIIRVGDTYYMASTTMVNMPGCSLLRSYDLIRWELAGYLYDALPVTAGRAMEQCASAYGQGMWAPTLRWHRGVFHICFTANDTHCTYHYWSESFDGPWQMEQLTDFYYDCSLFFDEDDRIYMIHGHNRVYITELDAQFRRKPGGLDRLLIEYGEGPLGYEGSHMYRHDGRYCLFTIHSNRNGWYREESCFTALRLTDAFEGGVILHDDLGYHQHGAAQGGIVDTPDGRWFTFLFQDRGASGRMPVLAPMRWVDGLPVLGVDGRLDTAVCNLSTRPGDQPAPISHSDDFEETQLSPAWQWNHIPELRLVQTGGGALRITTSKVCDRITGVQNVLTQRAESPVCVCEVTVSADELLPGDWAGLCVFQRHYAGAGLRRTAEGFQLEVRARTDDDPEDGRTVVSIPWPEHSVTLRMVLDFGDMRDEASFAVLQQGIWQTLYAGHRMRFTLDHFTGNKAALVVTASQQVGGTAVFTHFRLEKREHV